MVIKFYHATKTETPMELTRDILQAMPKVLLHDHLDGGVRPQTVIDLAREQNYTKLPTTDAGELSL